MAVVDLFSELLFNFTFLTSPDPRQLTHSSTPSFSLKDFQWCSQFSVVFFLSNIAENSGNCHLFVFGKFFVAPN